jgi:hypothetical protein
MTGRVRWAISIAAIVLFGCVLSFYQTTDAAQRGEAKAPFANALDQRIQMVEELKAIRALLKEQNALLAEQNKLIGSGQRKAAAGQPN